MPLTLDERAARQVAAEVDASNGRLLLNADSLAFVFAEPSYHGDSRDRIARSLAKVGVAVAPRFAGKGSSPRVELSRSASESLGGDWTAGMKAARDDQFRRDAAFARSSRVVLVSGLVTVALLTIYGVSGYWVYGAILAGVGTAALTFARYRPMWLLPAWYPRPKRRRVWAFALGVWPVLVVSALAGVFIIAPVDVARTHAANRRAAEALIPQANAAITVGEAERARALITKAHHLSAHAPGLAAATTRLDALDAQRGKARTNAEVYLTAKQAMAAKHYHRAIVTLGALGDYRDSRALAKRYRAVAAHAIVAKAARIDATEPRGAIRLAELASSYRSLPAEATVIKRAKSKLKGAG